MKILVVDDTPDMVHLLSFHLKRQGYQIVAASCGEDALRLAGSESPDLILMDVNMPGMTGLDACRRLKADPGLPQIPVILITCHDSGLDIANGLDAGADDYITKPFNPAVLAARVRAALRVKTAADRLREANRKLEDEIAQRRRAERALLETEDQLRQAQKLEAIGRLAGGVAHEFNNLLQVIGGYAKLAMQGLAGMPNVERSNDEHSTFDIRHSVCRDLQEVLGATDRASTLTRQLLGFSRRKPLERVSVNPHDLVRDAVHLARPALGDHIELQTDLSEEPGTIYADPGELQQALLNLCLNARDAMPGGGKLLLKTERMKVESQMSNDEGHSTLDIRRSSLQPGDEICPGEYAVVHVADTGCGMTAEIKERIFEPFFTTKEVGKGTGLGLANVHGVVRQHGGVVLVDSEPGRGATFRVFLPIERPAQDERPLNDAPDDLDADDDFAPEYSGHPAEAGTAGVPGRGEEEQMCVSQ